MNSERQHSKPGKATMQGGADLHGAVLRIPRDSSFGMHVSADAVEIALSAEAVADIRTSLKGPAPVREYHTVSEEAGRIGLSEKTLRNLLKERGAPHYVIGSDIRIE